MNGIIFGVAGLAVGLLVALLLKSSSKKTSTAEVPTGVALTAADTVSYTHLTLPTNREV